MLELELTTEVPVCSNNLVGQCRLCLKHDTDITSIFEEETSAVNGARKKPLVQHLEDVLQIQYIKSSSLPNGICQICLKMIDNFIMFRENVQKCELSQQTRLNMIKLTFYDSFGLQRPGLNGNPGIFIPNKDTVVLDVFPNEECGSSDDEFSMDSDLESEVFSSQKLLATLTNSNNLPAITKANDKNSKMTNLQNPEFPSSLHTMQDSSTLEFVTKNAFYCQYCDMSFSMKNDCIEHEKLHDGALPYFCSFCPLRAAFRPNLIAHIKEQHNAERPFICDICKKGFVRRSDLKKHTIVHTGVRPFTCIICGKCFSRNTNLNKHMRIHSSVKPHVCQYCPRAFSTANELQRHSRMHTEIKPFKCGRCSASFAHKDKLQQHENAHHTLGSENQIQSNDLLEISSQKSVISDEFHRHRILTTQLKQSSSVSQLIPRSIIEKSLNKKGGNSRHFICNICSKSFTRERDLHRHQALHLDSLFTCKKCDISFNRREKLVRHEQERHSIQYSCEICRAIFNTQNELVSHHKVHTLQENMALSTQSVIHSIDGETSSISLSKDVHLQQRSTVDISFYNQMVPTMNLGFYSETRPEDRNGM